MALELLEKRPQCDCLSLGLSKFTQESSESGPRTCPHNRIISQTSVHHLQVARLLVFRTKYQFLVGPAPILPHTLCQLLQVPSSQDSDSLGSGFSSCVRSLWTWRVSSDSGMVSSRKVLRCFRSSVSGTHQNILDSCTAMLHYLAEGAGVGKADSNQWLGFISPGTP